MDKSPDANSRRKLTRRQLLLTAAAAAVAAAALRTEAAGVEPQQRPEHPALARALAELEPYLFAQERFGDVSRGEPAPHSLSEERRREAGLTR